MLSWSISPDMTGPRITIVYADGRYKVFRNGEQLRVPMSTGKTLPVEFETREAAEGYRRAFLILFTEPQPSTGTPNRHPRNTAP
jgi:hypothetical protein